MPSVSVTYTFDTSEPFDEPGSLSYQSDGFLLISVGHNASDGSPDAGCLRFADYSYAGTNSERRAGDSTSNSIESLTWEDLGVPVGESVQSVEFSAKVKLVKKIGCYEITLWVNAWHGSPPGSNLVNNHDIAAQTEGVWQTVTAGAHEIPVAYRASDTPIAWDLAVDFQSITPVDAEVLLDTVTFTINYGPAPPDPDPDPDPDEEGDPDPEPGGGGPNLCSWTVRNIPALLLAHLQGESLTLAYLVKLVRTDDVTFGFTSHDAPISINSVTYRPEAGCQITTLRSEIGGRVNNLDVQGTLASPYITDTDLRAGLYDGAELTIYLCNWASPTDGVVTLGRGWMGDVTILDIGWSAEFRSLAQRLQLVVVENTSPLCRVKALGDAKCAPGGTFADGAVLSDYQFSRTVSVVTSLRELTFAASAEATGYFVYGRCLMETGDNVGLAREIKSHTLDTGTAVIVLQESFPFAVDVGDVAMLEAGCDRRLFTCRTRFANALNMRAEPHLATKDGLKRKGWRS